MPPLHADVVPVLNQRAADQVADQLDRMGSDAGRGGSESFSRTFSNGLGGLRGIGAEAGSQFSTGLRSGIDDAISGATRQFGAFGESVNGVLTGLTRGAGLAAVGVAGIGVAAVAVGKQLYDLGSVWDDIGDSIAVRTGKLGGDLTQITDMVRDLGAETAAPLKSIGDIAGQVSQAMGLTGNDLRDVTQAIADLNEMTGEQANIRQLGKTFRIFDVNSADQVAALDSLLNASQATGASINELIASMSNAGKVTAQFGMGFGETAALLTTFEEAGVDINKVAPAMTIALKNFAAAGREPQEALRETIVQIKALSDAGNASAATLAQQTFGRGYIDFLEAIRGGDLNVDAITKAFEKQGATIKETRDETADLSEEWTKFTNQLETDLAPTAEVVFGGINQMIQQYLIRPLNELRDMKDLWGLLGSGTPPTPDDPRTGLPATQANAPAGTRDTGGVNPITGLPDAQANSPAGTRDSGGLPGVNPGVVQPDKPDGWGRTYPGWLGHPDSKSGRGPRLPEAPVLPVGELPGIAPGLEMTAGLFSAQSSVADAQHREAEKRARLNQLERSNVATEADIQKARNELLEAQRGSQAAQMRFAEAQQQAYEQQTRQMNNMARGLEDFGAKIDNDFGASEGLAGIAENVFKFLANLAMAPVFGALGAVRSASGFDKDSGSGLLGLAGNTGAFGSQFTAEARAAARGSSSGAATPASYTAALPAGGYPGDAALLSMVPKGIGQYDNVTKDLSKGLVDCASGVEDLVNIIDGKSTAGGSLWTGNAASVLPGMGFMPGMGGPGDFRIGYRNGGPGGGHMQATLPDGTNVNFGSTSAIQAGGLDGSAGAFDPSFTDHYYRPVTSPLAPPSSSGGGGGGAGGGGGSQWFGPPAPASLESLNGDPSLTNPALTPGIVPQGGYGITGGPGQAGGPGFGSFPLGPQPGMPGTPFGAPSIGGAALASAPSQSVIGGRTPGQGQPASGGIGFNGGIIGAAMSSAASAAGGMGSFGAGGAAAGAVSDIAIQEIGRAIGAGGQYVGAAFGGLLETLSLNDSALGDPSNSWFGRIGTAAAGVRPALPNSAGMLGGAQNPNMAEGGKAKPPGPLTPEQAKEQQAAQAGAGGNVDNSQTNNVTIQNPQTRDLDGSMRDAQTALGNQQAARQPR